MLSFLLKGSKLTLSLGSSFFLYDEREIVVYCLWRFVFVRKIAHTIIRYLIVVLQVVESYYIMSLKQYLERG